MTRKLDVATLDGAARHYAGEWLRPDQKSPSGERFVGGPAYVLQDLYDFTYKDEFQHVLERVRGWMGAKALADFEASAKARFAPRDDAVLAHRLRERLAVDVEGNHIPGAIGTTQIGNRIIGAGTKIVQLRRGPITLAKNLYWPIYAGEGEERAAGSDAVDEFPEGTVGLPLGANVPNISAALAVILADAVDAEINVGSTAANIAGRSGSQPVDPDAAETGTLLFTLVMSDPAFGAAADDSPGGLITASAITDDSSADATGTLGYCRVKATGSGADDVVDGEAGTSGADFNFNTLAIVSGSTVSMTSFTILVPQGSTAT